MLSRSATRETTRIYQFKGKEKLVKHQKFSKYFDHGCSFSVLSIHALLNFGYLSLELHGVPIFWWESDTSGNLSLYSAQTSLKLEGPALQMHLLRCRTGICSWNLSVEVSLMLGDLFPVLFLCNLKPISLYFIQNSMQITST